MEKLSIIKIGGHVIDAPEILSKFLTSFATVNGKKILVHGGGKVASRLGERLGIAPKYIDGRRITDDDTLDLVTMVYGGLINKQMVALLQASGCNALGLTGADANLIPASKRPVKTIDYGWAGDIEQTLIPIDTWCTLLHMGITPVCAPLTHNGKGHMLNTNADTIASALAVALSNHFEVRLVYCFEKKGVLEQIADDHSVIKAISRSSFEAMVAAGKLHSGILPKIENALQAVEKGVKSVVIGHADDLAANLEEKAAGTLIH